jgi:hypothetical protein
VVKGFGNRLLLKKLRGHAVGLNDGALESFDAATAAALEKPPQIQLHCNHIEGKTKKEICASSIKVRTGNVQVSFTSRTKALTLNLLLPSEDPNQKASK